MFSHQFLQVVESSQQVSRVVSSRVVVVVVSPSEVLQPEVQLSLLPVLLLLLLSLRLDDVEPLGVVELKLLPLNSRCPVLVNLKGITICSYMLLYSSYFYACGTQRLATFDSFFFLFFFSNCQKNECGKVRRENRSEQEREQGR